jgi:SHS2 domain-containing protein
MIGHPPFAHYEFLEHTADIRLKVQASSLEELFTSAAQGMMEYLFGERAAELTAEQEDQIEIAADDLESLLVEWLSKLLLYSSTQYRACLTYQVSSIDHNHLNASVGSASANATQEIKAVTYSDLKIERKGGTWQCAITFDI